jgi:hypothetical protein
VQVGLHCWDDGENLQERDRRPECCLSGVVPSLPVRLQWKFGEGSVQKKGTSACDNDRVSLSNAMTFWMPSNALGHRMCIKKG